MEPILFYLVVGLSIAYESFHLYESLDSVDWLLFQSSMMSGLGINPLYLWFLSSQCFQFKSFFVLICSRDVSLSHPSIVLLSFQVIHPCVSFAQYLLVFHTIYLCPFCVDDEGYINSFL